MTLTFYEIGRLSLEPFMPPLYRTVRRRLLRETHGRPDRPLLLDVGGRKSPYTIGVPANMTIIDLPRETEIQRTLHLGVNDSIVSDLKRRRSNMTNFVFGDMTRSPLPSDSFDLVVSVEVIEHVEEDEKFVSEIHRVLRPGGRFIMTTPNGDYLENRNPDHKRHYRKEQLHELLGRHFKHVEIDYAIAGGYFRRVGLRPWSVSHPVRTLSSIFGNLVNSVQSRGQALKDRAAGTHHLFAVAGK
jgi:SAM-dependent methyltransferase